LQLFDDTPRSDPAGLARNYADDPSGPEIKKEGKTGLALSGGGFRSALFHIGVLAALAEKNELKNIEVISCVSGGSIIGAYYYLKLKTLLESKADGEITREDYIRIVKEIEEDFLKGIQNNLRMRIFSNLAANLKMMSKHYSRTHRLGELYEEYLFKPLVNIKRTQKEIENGKREDEIYMSDLYIKPKGAPTDFLLAIDNWKRRNKVPQLVLNATSINTGHNWQFTASWMGEPPGNIQTDVDVKPRLRRMYYEEAPDRYKNFRLGYAVGASSCVPVMFQPLPLADLYPGIELELIDGGVHDNQGIGALIEQDCKNMIISDGSGQMPTDKLSSKNNASLFFRSDTILQERLRELQFLDIKQRNSTTQINRLITVHLKSDLENSPVSWKYCTDPPRTILYSNVSNNNNDLTKYGILRNVQLQLSQIRTDLDSFNDAESYALMYSGYMQVNYEYKKQDDEGFSLKENLWKFSKIRDYVTMPATAAKKENVFKEASRVPFKVFFLSRTVKLITLLLLVLILGGLLYTMFATGREEETWNYSLLNITVKLLVISLGIFLLGLISKVLATLANIKSVVRKQAAFIIVLIVAWIVSNLYLLLLNGVYNDYGKLDDEK
jgi:predicted acylesterase/phospholipase RssA